MSNRCATGRLRNGRQGELALLLLQLARSGELTCAWRALAPSQLLKRGQEVFQLLDEYKGCQDLARKVRARALALLTVLAVFLSDVFANKENEQAAFEGLLAAVDSISQFYHYSKELGSSLALATCD